MFGIGTTELVIILLVALIVLGPTKLPGIARSLGKAMGEFRRVTTDVQRTLNLEAAKIEEQERRKKPETPSPSSKGSAQEGKAEAAPPQPHPDQGQKQDLDQTRGNAETDHSAEPSATPNPYASQDTPSRPEEEQGAGQGTGLGAGQGKGQGTDQGVDQGDAQTTPAATAQDDLDAHARAEIGAVTGTETGTRTPAEPARSGSSRDDERAFAETQDAPSGSAASSPSPKDTA
jgi:sec-independent protein translocase protein TatB